MNAWNQLQAKINSITYMILLFLRNIADQSRHRLNRTGENADMVCPGTLQRIRTNASIQPAVYMGYADRRSTTPRIRCATSLGSLMAILDSPALHNVVDWLCCWALSQAVPRNRGSTGSFDWDRSYALSLPSGSS